MTVETTIPSANDQPQDASRQPCYDMAMSDFSGVLVIRRYRPAKDGAWRKNFPQIADPDGPVDGDGCSTWVATIGGKHAGICTWMPAEPFDQCVAHITRLWVVPEFRKQGVGTKLHLRVSSEIRKLYKKMDLRIKQHLITADCTDDAARPFVASLKFDYPGDQPVRHYNSE